MTFIQSMDFATEQRDEMLDVLQRWSADAIGRGSAVRATLTEDRSSPGRFVLSVRFDSAETAAANSDRPETGVFAAEFGALCSEGPEFREFDVVEVYGG
jgi:quinol monooxygenase YgiN